MSKNTDQNNIGEDSLSSWERELIGRLRANPEAAEQIGEVMGRLEQETARGASADEVEEMAIVELRKLGEALLGGWAQRTQREAAKAADDDPHLTRHSKKNASGTPPSEKSG